MKRKNEAPVRRKAKKSKKRAIPDDEAQQNFRKGLFDSSVLDDYTKSYASSKPYVEILEPSERQLIL
jgi:prolyl 3-hydroxylase /prolyl 3,4-dihydroxylase